MRKTATLFYVLHRNTSVKTAYLKAWLGSARGAGRRVSDLAAQGGDWMRRNPVKTLGAAGTGVLLSGSGSGGRGQTASTPPAAVTPTTPTPAEPKGFGQQALDWASNNKLEAGLLAASPLALYALYKAMQDEED